MSSTWQVVTSTGTLSLDAISATDCTVSFRNLEADECRVVVASDYESMLPGWGLSYGGSFSLMKDGVRVFLGQITHIQRDAASADEGITITASGGWWFLDAIVYTVASSSVAIQNQGAGPILPTPDHLTYSTFASSRRTVGANKTVPFLNQLNTMLTAARTQAGTAVFQIGTVDLPSITVPDEEYTDTTFAVMIRSWLTKYCPTAVATWDYSTTPPTLHIIAASSTAVTSVDVGSSITTPGAFLSADIAAREDLRIRQVKLVSEVDFRLTANDMTDGNTVQTDSETTQVYLVGTDTYPSGVSGGQNIMQRAIVHDAISVTSWRAEPISKTCRMDWWFEPQYEASGGSLVRYGDRLRQLCYLRDPNLPSDIMRTKSPSDSWLWYCEVTSFSYTRTVRNTVPNSSIWSEASFTPLAWKYPSDQPYPPAALWYGESGRTTGMVFLCCDYNLDVTFRYWPRNTSPGTRLTYRCTVRVPSLRSALAVGSAYFEDYWHSTPWTTPSGTAIASGIYTAANVLQYEGSVRVADLSADEVVLLGPLQRLVVLKDLGSDVKTMCNGYAIDLRNRQTTLYLGLSRAITPDTLLTVLKGW